MSPETGPAMEDVLFFLRRAPSAYIVLSPTAATSPDFPLKGYAGPSGRLDVVARAMTAPLHFDREAVSIGILLGPPRPPLTIMGYRDCLGSGERSAMTALRLALQGRPPKGCMAVKAGHDFILHVLAKSGFNIIYLSEKGEDLALKPDVVECRCAYFAGAHVDIPPNIESDILESAKAIISIGLRSLLTSHVFAFIAWLRGIAAYRVGGSPGGGSFYTTS